MTKPKLLTARGKLFHVECRECCVLGRCHWCAIQPGPCTVTAGPVTFHACHQHAKMFQTDPELNKFGVSQMIARAKESHPKVEDLMLVAMLTEKLSCRLEDIRVEIPE